MRKMILFLAALICGTGISVFAQADQSDSSIYEQSIQNAIGIYYKSAGENSHLYNGSEYVPLNTLNHKNPFFETSTLQNASISYDGIVYNNVPLQYDIFNEEIIINRYNQNFRIKLVNNKINWFSIYGHAFIRIEHDSSTKILPDAGFYDQLYSGTVTVFAKRKKKLEENIAQNVINSQFVEDDHFFIKKDNIYYPVNSKKSTFKVFKDRKKEVQKLMRKNKVKFKPSLEFGIVKAAQYYDQTKN
jgi:hypothetical protein